MVNDSTFKNEEKKLSKTIELLIKARESLNKIVQRVGGENLDLLESLRNNPETSGTDFFVFMEKLHTQNTALNLKDKFQRLEEFKYQLAEPYFARLDLRDMKKDHDETFYIGKFGFTDKVPVIIDWRAKIASIYYRYRYPQKHVKYESEYGTERLDLLLKRTFDIENGELIKFYNNDIKLDENEIITDKIKKRTGGVLEDIVETIQRSQLDIIEADPRQLCIVQGCVGSGKSTVAIHKLAHIFFNFPKLIHPERTILIVKNQILVGYLSTLFPKLGIFNINYGTIKDLLINLYFREGLSVEIDLDKANDSFLEYNIDSIRKMEQEIYSMKSMLELQIKKIFENPELESYGGQKFDYSIPALENINSIIEDLNEEIEIQGGIIADESISNYRKEVHRMNIKTIKKLITKLKKLSTEYKRTSLYTVLLSINVEAKKKLSYNEFLCYIYIFIEIVGLSNFKKYEYCVIDEGQDFSALEYLVLGKLVINARFAIFGDLNQGFNNDNISDWSEILSVLDTKDRNVFFELDTSYRCTKQIVRFANEILLNFTKLYLPKSIDRNGEIPTAIEVDRNNDVAAKFLKRLEMDSVNYNKSIGIIFYDEDMLNQFKSILEGISVIKDRLIVLDETKRINYISSGIYLMNFESCKGLEFSKAYVFSKKKGLNITFDEAKKEFVAVTRAMNDLVVYYIKEGRNA